MSSDSVHAPARGSSGTCAVPVVLSQLIFVITRPAPRGVPDQSRNSLHQPPREPVLPPSPNFAPRSGDALARMSSLVGATLLARRCSLWRSACRPLMMAAMGQPRVTQDASRNGQVTIAPADAATHTATFVGPSTPPHRARTPDEQRGPQAGRVLLLTRVRLALDSPRTRRHEPGMAGRRDAPTHAGGVLKGSLGIMPLA